MENDDKQLPVPAEQYDGDGFDDTDEGGGGFGPIEKPAISVDTTHTRVDIAQLYLQALKQANGVPDGGTTINGAAEPTH
jgi:hypothetical protein